MKTPFPTDDESVLHRFDRLCQMALKGEAINYYKHMDYRRRNEIMLSVLSETEVSKLYTYDEYPSEHELFEVQGNSVVVKDALLAEALKHLTPRKREVVLLAYFMDMNDAEIARQLKLVQSTVCVHHKRSLEILKTILEMLSDEEKKE